MPRWLLHHGGHPNGPYVGPDGLGHSPHLAVASARGNDKMDLKVMKLLLEHGGNVRESRALST